MSSVTRFLRQRQTGQTMLTGPAATSGNYFTFVAGSGNYVGNYPPGTMIDVSTTVNALLTINGASTSAPVLRDMGKTIKASVANGSTLGSAGFFREVQLIVPVTVASATAQSNNGVIGPVPGSLPAGNPGDAGYATFYIPIIVDGVVAGTAASPSLPLTVSPAGIIVGEQL